MAETSAPISGRDVRVLMAVRGVRLSTVANAVGQRPQRLADRLAGRRGLPPELAQRIVAVVMGLEP